jgi:hypothetical protein
MQNLFPPDETMSLSSGGLQGLLWRSSPRPTNEKSIAHRATNH